MHSQHVGGNPTAARANVARFWSDATVMPSRAKDTGVASAASTKPANWSAGGGFRCLNGVEADQIDHTSYCHKADTNDEDPELVRPC